MKVYVVICEEIDYRHPYSRITYLEIFENKSDAESQMKHTDWVINKETEWWSRWTLIEKNIK